MSYMINIFLYVSDLCDEHIIYMRLIFIRVICAINIYTMYTTKGLLGYTYMYIWLIFAIFLYD